MASASESTSGLAQAAIQVRVKLFAAYQEAYGQDELNLTLPSDITVSQLIDRLLAEQPQLERWRDVTRYGVNLAFVEGDRPLNDGDEVVFIPPVSGG